MSKIIKLDKGDVTIEPVDPPLCADCGDRPAVVMVFIDFCGRHRQSGTAVNRTQSMNTTQKQTALARIDGWIVGNSVIYYDDSMHRYYVGPASDLDYLCDLMASDDEDVSRDAYSHWCAGVTHGDGYEMREAAEAAAAIAKAEDSQ